MWPRGHVALRVLLAGLSVMAGLISFQPATAIGLQVSPVGLTLTGSRPADGLWLSNTSSEVIHAQVRVYHWTQDGGVEAQTPTRGLVISPPMLEIPPGQKQLVRVIRTGAPPIGPGAREDAYRISVDELPLPSKVQIGVRFVVHYSLPVFVTPAGKASPTPQLGWSIHRDGDHAVLEVSNHGTGHAQLVKLNFIDPAGQRAVITPGLLGYALAGQTMRWPLKQRPMMFAGGGTLEVQLNDEPVSVPIAPLDAAR